MLRYGLIALTLALLAATGASWPLQPAEAGSKIIHHGQVKKKPMPEGGKGRVSWLGGGRCPISRFKNQRSLFLVPEDFWPRQKQSQVRGNPFLLLEYYKDQAEPPTSLQIEDAASGKNPGPMAPARWWSAPSKAIRISGMGSNHPWPEKNWTRSSSI
jgi:hypothetical protein